MENNLIKVTAIPSQNFSSRATAVLKDLSPRMKFSMTSRNNRGYVKMLTMLLKTRPKRYRRAPVHCSVCGGFVEKHPV